jgi:hypothetical protein
VADVLDLGQLVRKELRDPIADVVRLLVVELARDELGRIAASLNGGPGPTGSIVLPSPQDRQTPRALPEASHAPQTRKATRRRCSSCGQEKAARSFEKGRSQCRDCRHEAARRRYRERQARIRAAAEENGAEPSEEPG